MDRRHGKTPSNFDMTYCLFDPAGADVGAFLPSMSADPLNLQTIAARRSKPRHAGQQNVVNFLVFSSAALARHASFCKETKSTKLMRSRVNKVTPAQRSNPRNPNNPAYPVLKSASCVSIYRLFQCFQKTDFSGLL
jgi:hypothetical protein